MYRCIFLCFKVWFSHDYFQTFYGGWFSDGFSSGDFLLSFVFLCSRIFFSSSSIFSITVFSYPIYFSSLASSPNILFCSLFLYGALVEMSFTWRSVGWILFGWFFRILGDDLVAFGRSRYPCFCYIIGCYLYIVFVCGNLEFISDIGESTVWWMLLDISISHVSVLDEVDFFWSSGNILLLI